MGTAFEPLYCPNCGLSDVRRSRRRWTDLIFYMLGQVPYRCQICNRRFHRRAEPIVESEKRQSRGTGSY